MVVSLLISSVLYVLFLAHHLVSHLHIHFYFRIVNLFPPLFIHFNFSKITDKTNLIYEQKQQIVKSVSIVNEFHCLVCQL